MTGLGWVSRKTAYTINKGEHKIVNIHAVEACRGAVVQLHSFLT
jgi:hypothetical protein